MDESFEIFLVAAPGLEAALLGEATERGFSGARSVPGGVALDGGWHDVWRANLQLRCATRVLARVASFRAMHLAQLDKRARRVNWSDYLRPGLPVAVEAACHRSKIYHAGAAAERVATAIASELGTPISDAAEIRVMLRIDDDLATISIDTSGEPLHKRGHKEAVNRAPMRETMAAALLRSCGFDGRQAVVDPMCGSGTFVIEAAEIAMGLQPGRSRAFAFRHLAGFDQEAWAAMLAPPPATLTELRMLGSDRDAGAVAMARENAERAGVSAATRFEIADVATLAAPPGPPGIVIVNPPYGNRVGDKRSLAGLYRTLGERLRTGFAGWRVGLVTTDAGLAQATGLPWLPPGPPILHGGLRIRLWQTGPLS